MQRQWLGLLSVVVLSSAAGPYPSGQSIDPVGAVAPTPPESSLDARYKYIEIRGGGSGFGGNNFGRDWTAGCVALADDYMDRLAAFVQVGTRMVIVRYGTLFPEELAPGLPNLNRWEKKE